MCRMLSLATWMWQLFKHASIFGINTCKKACFFFYCSLKDKIKYCVVLQTQFSYNLIFVQCKTDCLQCKTDLWYFSLLKICAWMPFLLLIIEFQLNTASSVFHYHVNEHTAGVTGRQGMPNPPGHMTPPLSLRFMFELLLIYILLYGSLKRLTVCCCHFFLLTSMLCTFSCKVIKIDFFWVLRLFSNFVCNF